MSEQFSQFSTLDVEENEYIKKLTQFDGLINIISTADLQYMFHIDKVTAETLRFDLNQFEFDEMYDYENNSELNPFRSLILKIMNMDISERESGRQYIQLQSNDPYAIFWHVLVHKTFYILTQKKYHLKTCNVHRLIRCSDGYYAECSYIHRVNLLSDVKLDRKKDKKNVLITILEGLKNTNGRYDKYNISFSHRNFTINSIGWDGKRAYIFNFWRSCITKTRTKKNQLSSLSKDGSKCKNPSYDACTFILSLPDSWDSLVGQLKKDIISKGPLSFDKDIKQFHPKNILKTYFSNGNGNGKSSNGNGKSLKPKSLKF